MRSTHGNRQFFLPILCAAAVVVVVAVAVVVVVVVVDRQIRVGSRIPRWDV